MRYTIKIRDELGDLKSEAEFDGDNIELETTISVLETLVMKYHWTIEIQVFYSE